MTNPSLKRNLFLIPSESPHRGHRQQGSARVVLLALTSFFLGAALAAFWVSHSGHAPASAREEAGDSRAGLSESTRNVLSALSSPVELRFYSVLEAGQTPDSLRAFAGRVDQLLAQYQRVANGKIMVTHSNSQAYTNVDAAIADGLKPFNEEKGEPALLGIAVINQNHKTALAQLAPEWEPALEYDLTRAILTVSKVVPKAGGTTPPGPPVSSGALEEIKQIVPNLESVSLADATRLVREASLKEFAAAAAQFQAQLNEAQQRLKDAQNGGSDSDRQAAMKNLQAVQADQANQLKKIAAKAQDQIEALKHLKPGN